MRLDMIGDGPMRAALEAQAARLGIAGAVRFHGNLAHTEVQGVAAACNLLTFPSIREFGGGVVLEAMALGVVPVVVDYAGPGELVSERTGYKLPVGSRAEIVAGLRDCLGRIAADPSPLPELGRAARAHVQAHFTWAAKARQVRRVYDAILAGKPLPRDLL